MIDLSSVIKSFGTIVEVERLTAGAWVDGVMQSSTASVKRIIMSIQPTSGKDVKLLADGARADDTITAYSIEALRTADDLQGTLGDRIRWGGFKWEVQHVEDWLIGGQGKYHKAVARRVRV